MSPADARAGGPAPAAADGSAPSPRPPGPNRGATPIDAVTPPGHQTFWLWVMCLMGVNYFGTLAYQPSIAFEAAGLLAPLATIVLIALTLFGALPVLRRVAKKSPLGLGSIGLHQRFFGGWFGRGLLLVCLGFAATDFVITKTLSAADAAEHLIQNPFWAGAPAVLQDQMLLAMALLVMLGAFLLRDLRKVIVVAVVLVGAYLLLNLVVIMSGLWHLASHPDILTDWYENVAAGRWYLDSAPVGGHGVLSVLLVSLLLYPKLAIGLSGLETGTALMPLVRGEEDDNPKKPLGRIRETRKLLTTAALVMSFLLLGSSVVTSLLIMPEAMLSEGPAANRALAFIAHGETAAQISPLFGGAFGTLYDVGTVAILWFAGASAISILLNLAPRYLPSLGIASHAAKSLSQNRLPRGGQAHFTPQTPQNEPVPDGSGIGSKAIWLLVIAAIGVILLVTWIFDASVQAQAGAYATAVLVLICGDCLAVTLVDWKRRRGAWYKKLSWRYLAIMLVFLYGAVAIAIDDPAGLLVAGAFVLAMLVFSMFWRTRRGVANAGDFVS